MRAMRGALVLPFVAGCAIQPPPPQASFPTLEPGETFHTRMAALRTVLGRAGIALRTAVVDDTFESEDCRDGALFAGARCVRCQLTGAHSPLDGAVYEAATRAFALYPAESLAATKIEYVALCREITVVRDGKPQPIAGTVDLSGRGLLISLGHFLGQPYHPRGTFTIDDIVHHELFHLVDYVHYPSELADDPEWQLFNPVGFEYGTSGVGRDGFVNAYATTAEHEDRASVYEMMISRPDELCELVRGDDIIASKASIIGRRVARVLGEDFVRDRAECAAPAAENRKQEGRSSSSLLRP